MVLRDQDKFVFYINNCINWDKFNQFYNAVWIKKDIENADAIIHKLKPTSIKATNNKLEFVRKKSEKK